MSEYKIGDPIRIKANGWMGYYNGFYKTMHRLVSEKGMCSETSTDPAYIRQVIDLNKIEPLPLRHPYYGRMVLVWDNTNNKAERIFVDAFDNKIVAVAGGQEKCFNNNVKYNVTIWHNWEPLPEKTEHQQKLEQLTQRLEATQKEMDAIRAEIEELRNE